MSPSPISGLAWPAGCCRAPRSILYARLELYPRHVFMSDLHLSMDQCTALHAGCAYALPRGPASHVVRCRGSWCLQSHRTFLKASSALLQAIVQTTWQDWSGVCPHLLCCNTIVDSALLPAGCSRGGGGRYARLAGAHRRGSRRGHGQWRSSTCSPCSTGTAPAAGEALAMPSGWEPGGLLLMTLMHSCTSVRFRGVYWWDHTDGNNGGLQLCLAAAGRPQ